MTFYFYDLETSSGSSRGGRIMQFAGQRTNEQLEPVGEPDNVLVKLADDIIPEPDAVLIHGITPQQANADGMSEAEFAAFFHEKIVDQDTVFVGYNNIRFDDEFIRQLCYRTFYDPYEWHWKNGRGRWDLMDPIRMMRALRPEGLKWPFLDGKPTVKLELMAKENGITHDNAHDALSDVEALIELARRFRTSQPRLFDYLLLTKDKRQVAKVATSGQPFVYTSGKYDNKFLKTTVVLPVFVHPRREAAIVYDLRHDPTEWLELSAEQLAEHWAVRYGDDKKPLPVKTMQFNRCPAIAPISVLDDESKKRIDYTADFAAHEKILSDNAEFIEKLKMALDIIEKEQQARLPLDDVDTQLYDGFWTDTDRSELNDLRHTDPQQLGELQVKIKNKRLREMAPLYKARNFPKLLTPEEYEAWESRRRKLFLDGGSKSAVNKVVARMQEIAKTRQLTENDTYLLSELQLYIESILPEPAEG
jgi:exodeoxyribonuclease-1